MLQIAHFGAVVLAGRRKVREHLGAVYALPPESIVGIEVVFRPAQLTGHKVIHVAQLHDLRQRGGIAEHVRQPEDAVVLAEFLAEELLAIQELAYQRFARRDVAVGLDPHAAFRLPAAIGNRLLDALVQFRRVLLHKLIQDRLTGHELVFGILLHQVQNRGKAAHGLVPRLIQIPQPGHVDVRVAHAVRVSDGRELRALLIVFRAQVFARGLDAGVKFRAVRLAQVQHVDRLAQREQRGFPLALVLGHQLHGFPRHADVVHQAHHLVVPVAQFQIQARRLLHIGGVGIKLQFNPRARNRLVHQQASGVARVERLDDLAILLYDELRVDRFPAGFITRGGGQKYRARKRSRYLRVHAEIPPFAFPAPKGAIFKRLEGVFPARGNFQTGNRLPVDVHPLLQLFQDAADAQISLMHGHSPS